MAEVPGVPLQRVTYIERLSKLQMRAVRIILTAPYDTASSDMFKTWPTIQEVFHVYLNKFENAVTHLFLVILGYN